MAHDPRELWSTLDRYIAAQLIPAEADPTEALAASKAAGIPTGAIPPTLGRLLELLVRISGARAVLELGTLGGYSTIWLARALPNGGRLITLEVDPRHAEVARSNLAHAGLAETAEVRLGPALESLAALRREGAGPFDLTFIDADKKSNPAYLEAVLSLSRPGSVIVADNVVRAGAILDPQTHDPRLDEGGLAGLRRFYEMLGQEHSLRATAIQTVGIKGHDGFAIALVTGTAPGAISAST
jgi:predicted O-methyltransferase YrrM